MTSTATPPQLRAAHVFFVEAHLLNDPVLKTKVGPQNKEVERRDGTKNMVHELSYATALRLLQMDRIPTNCQKAEVLDVARQISEGAVTVDVAATPVPEPPAAAPIPPPAPAPAPAAAAAVAPAAATTATSAPAVVTAPAKKPRGKKTATAEAPPAAAAPAPAVAAAPTATETPAPPAPVAKRSSFVLLPVAVLLESARFFLEQQQGVLNTPADKKRYEQLCALVAEVKATVD